MLEQMILLVFDIILISIYMFIGFIMFMIIQLISYRVFNFNLYKWLYKKINGGCEKINGRCK